MAIEAIGAIEQWGLVGGTSMLVPAYHMGVVRADHLVALYAHWDLARFRPCTLQASVAEVSWKCRGSVVEVSSSVFSLGGGAGWHYRACSSLFSDHCYETAAPPPGMLVRMPLKRCSAARNATGHAEGVNPWR